MTFERYRGGRLPPHPDETHPRLWASDFFRPGDTAILSGPQTVDYISGVPGGYPMDLNDQLGDCGIAGADHYQIAATWYARQVCASWGNATCMRVYGSVGGYVPGQPGTDNGIVLQDMLDFWRKEGVQRPDGSVDKILAYGALRSWNRPYRVHALRTFGPGYTGLTLQNAQEQQFPNPWEWVQGGSIAGGHCVTHGAEFEGTNELALVSWGQIVRASQNFWMNACEEYWVIITQDFLERTGYNPSGIDLAAMNEALAALTGQANMLGLTTTIAPGGIPMSEQSAEAVPAVSEPQNTVSLAPEDVPTPTPVPDEPQPSAEVIDAPPFVGTVPASAANETPTLQPGAAAAAAKAHALYGHIVQVAKAAQAEIERFVPPEVLQAAEREAGLFVRSIL